MKKSRVLMSSLFFTLVSANAMASERIDESSTPTSSESQFVVSLGIGGQLKPRYPGSSKYLLSPFPIIDVDRFYLPGFGQILDRKEDKKGLGFFPSFSFVGGRDASDSSDLAGTDSIDWAFEAGLGVRYRQDWFQAFAKVHQGFNGHNGQVGEVGVDFVTRPTDRFELKAGPRLDWGSNDYLDTYFGVTAAEAIASRLKLSKYNPDGGIVSVGLAARAEYSFDERTTFHLRAKWNRYVGDAANSPIVKAGNIDQFSVGFGVSYRFNFDLFQ